MPGYRYRVGRLAPHQGHSAFRTCREPDARQRIRPRASSLDASDEQLRLDAFDYEVSKDTTVAATVTRTGAPELENTLRTPLPEPACRRMRA